MFGGLALTFIFERHIAGKCLSIGWALTASLAVTLFGIAVEFQTLYIRRIMLKIETQASISKVKSLLNDIRIEMTNSRQLSRTPYK